MKATVNQRTFLLCLVSLIGVLAFAFLHPDQGPGVMTTIPLILGAYAAASASKDISAHWAASKDPNADTESVITKLNERG